MMANFSAYSVIPLLLCCQQLLTEGINVKLDIGSKPIHRINTKKFVSVTFDTSIIRGDWCDINWINAIQLARILQPAYLRLGGDDADWQVFQKKSTTRPDKKSSAEEFPKQYPWPCETFAFGNFNLTEHHLDRLAWFISYAKTRLIFDINQVYGGVDGHWNPANFQQILNYVQIMGYPMDFELGNEPDDYPGWHNFTINGTVITQNYKRLHTILKGTKLYKNSMVVGPAIGSPYSKQFRDFLVSGGTKYVDAITFHQYYGCGRTATVADFLKPKLLDRLAPEVMKAISMTKKYSRPGKAPEVWLGETASLYDGGAVNLSDAYLAGFMWMDKLGVSAKLGLSAVFRQTFYYGNYSLLNLRTLPNPDFWLSTIFKRVVGSGVLIVNVTSDNQTLNNYLRFYCHCSKKSLSLFGMNLLDEPAQLTLEGLNSTATEFLLSPVGDITSRDVALNGRKLSFNDSVPSLAGRATHTPLQLPAKRFAFWLIPTPAHVVC